MYSLFTGIDVSKADIHVAICVDGKSQFINEFSNDHDGFQEMIKSIKLYQPPNTRTRIKLKL